MGTDALRTLENQNDYKTQNCEAYKIDIS